METVELAAIDGWSSGPVLATRTFAERWRGLRRRPAGTGLLLRGRSVHGMGMGGSLWAVGLDAGGAVVGVRRLDPGRVVWLAGATWVLELPIERRPPPVGLTLGPLP